MNPVNSDRHPTDDDAARARRLDCAHVGQCLVIADRAGWRGFGCGSCTAYQRPDAAQREADRDGLLELRGAIVDSWHGRRRAP